METLLDSGKNWNEGRLRRYFVDPSLALAYLNATADWPRIFGRARIDRLPVDAKCETIRYDEDRRCFVVVVSSAWFDPVPAGSEIPLGYEGGTAPVKFAWLVRNENGAFEGCDSMADIPEILHRV